MLLYYMYYIKVEYIVLSVEQQLPDPSLFHM
jgi:hypothetical protein